MSKFPKPPGPSFDGTVYEDEEVGVLETLLPTGGSPIIHVPAMVGLPNGDLLTCWFAGTHEGSTDIHTVCSALRNGKTKWSAVTDLSHDPKKSEQNLLLSLGSDGAVWTMYIAQDDRESGKDNMQFTAEVRCQKSFGDGRSWGEHETVFPELRTFCRQPMQTLSNGRWIFSNWLCTDSPDGLTGDPTGFRTPDDQGKSRRLMMMPKGNGHVHANVIELSPERLVVFMQYRRAKRIHRSESFDWGESWSESVSIPLSNNSSDISAVKMKSGRTATAYSPTSVSKSQPDRAAWSGLHCPVMVAFSKDGGKTFPLIYWMERGEDFIGGENRTNNRQYECPCLIQGKDDILHLVYAARTREGIKYLHFHEEDIAGKKRETIGLYNPTVARSH